MPQIVEVPGRDNRAATWVAAVTLPKIDEEHLHVVKAFMRKKPFYFGFFVMSNKHLVIMHSKGDKVQRSQCTSALEHVLRVAGINAAIGEVVVLNGYHLELLGFRPNPGPALPKKVEPDIEVDEEEEEQLWAELLSHYLLPGKLRLLGRPFELREDVPEESYVRSAVQGKEQVQDEVYGH